MSQEGKPDFYTQKGYQMRSQHALTGAMEDYLEMICRQAEADGCARIGLLAEGLNVRPSSASKMVYQLRALGLVAFVFDTIGGVLVAKVYNLFAKQKINPMIGAAGISAFPMSARVVNKMGLQEDNQNFLLMHAVGVNVSGQIASVIAGGMILTLFA